MKKMIAKLLVMVMLLTSAVVPTNGNKSAHAAEKQPRMKISGGIENIKLLTERGMAQEPGKTITVTVEDVKKGNIKDITCYEADPNIATVTEKTVKKKKSGFKVKINKLGSTYLSVRLTLKKKQAGQKIWWKNIKVYGVKTLSKKEMADIPEKIAKALTHSTILNKYGSIRMIGKMYDESGKQEEEVDIYFTEEDYYVRDEILEKKAVYHSYTKSNTGYTITDIDNTVSDRYFCAPHDPYIILPVSDDPEMAQNMLDTSEAEYCYYDGSSYYLSEISNSKAEEWQRTESILDAKTYESSCCNYYKKNEQGKVYLDQSQSIETAPPVPDMYQTLKYMYAAEGRKKVKLESVIDPGLPEERRISMDIPEGARVVFGKLAGYEMFLDAEGTIPLSSERDTTHDFTVYYIKTEETA